MLIATAALVFASLVHSLAVEYAQEDIAQWQLFKTSYSKEYHSEEEEERRMKSFMDKLESFREHNLKYKNGEVSYDVGINHFADMSPDEFPAGLAWDKESWCEMESDQPRSPIRIPSVVDWRTKGVVTNVKDQKHCGSCWAFSATGALESQRAIKLENLVSLSEQNLVDCDKYDDGCKGGLPSSAYRYIAKAGIEREESYPYKHKNGTCKFNERKVAARCSGCRQVQLNEEALKIAVATVGPISVGIHATLRFRFYTEGIYKDPSCSSDLLAANHAVLVVGYGTTEQGEDYWIVKNSWGKSWGEEGYARMARNFNNMCGIANSAIYPVV